MRDCRRPAILAGQGARGAGQQLAEVSEILGAPIAKASLGKDCIPDDHPNVTGGIGVIGTRPTQEAMEGCDGLLVVGSSMPYIEFWPSPGQAACVQIDDTPERIGLRHPADVGLVGDAKATLAALIPFLNRNEDRAFLERLGVDAEILDSGCCGVAGSFGYHAGEPYEVSVKAGERVLLPAVRAAAAGTLVVTDGFSCRSQIEHGSDRRPLHLAQVARAALHGATNPAGVP